MTACDLGRMSEFVAWGEEDGAVWKADGADTEGFGPPICLLQGPG